VQNYAKTIVLLVRVSICIVDSSSRATYCEVSRGRGFDLHAGPKAHCFFRQIQVLRKDFSEELFLHHQALAKETVQSTINVKYGIPEVNIFTFAASSFANAEFLSSA
jgi:hypothetical protein